MKILFFEFGYTSDDMVDVLSKMGISFDIVSYCFGDKNHDEFFCHRFSKCLSNEYDAVMSVNYFPLIAKCCYEKNIKYISWSYDNPLNVPAIEETLGFSTNYVFLFDRVQVASYANMGFDNVYHLPLAVNCNRLDQIKLSSEEHVYYDSDISFVGKLYDSDFDVYRALMNPYQQGVVDGIVNAQSNLYGCFLVDNLITEDFIEAVNSHIREQHKEIGFRLTKEALSYALSANITRNERLMILGFLSRHYEVKLYTREQNEILKGAQYMGSCGYFKQMPRVFKASKINLNITLKCLQSGIPLRCMDILGAGGFLLSNFQPELAEFFENEKEVVMYESVEDACAKAAFYLNNDDLRKKIAVNGHDKVREYFSYEKQIKTMFDISKMV